MPNFKRIPFELGSEVLVQSPSRLAHKAITKVVGVVRDNFIIVETPVLPSAIIFQPLSKV